MAFMAPLQAKESEAKGALLTPIEDAAFLLFLAEGFEEDGEWISELELEEMPLDTREIDQESDAANTTAEALPSGFAEGKSREGKP